LLLFQWPLFNCKFRIEIAKKKSHYSAVFLQEHLTFLTGRVHEDYVQQLGIADDHGYVIAAPNLRSVRRGTPAILLLKSKTVQKAVVASY
jgi:hypothetical protein